MCKTIYAFAACILLLFSAASAETDYVNIASLRAAAPEHLQGEYITRDGRTISIDAPVIIPDVSNVPIVHITWGEPADIVASPAKIITNDGNILHLDHGFSADPTRILTDGFQTVNDRLPHTDAADVLLKNTQRIAPAFEPNDFECINALSYRSGSNADGFYMLFFARLYHGIPYLCNAPYAISLGSKEPAMPNDITHGCIRDENHYTISVSSPKELGIIESDVPLLPFSRIEQIISQRIEDGYIEYLDEIRFGYRIFIDPSNPGTEYILSPVWVFAGSMRASLDIPFTKEDVVFMPYKNMSSFAINAQTGEIYTFAFESSKSRQHAPHILTWNEIK